MNNMLTLADVLAFLDGAAAVTRERVKAHIDGHGDAVRVGDHVLCRVPAYLQSTQEYVRGVVRRIPIGSIASFEIRVDLPGGTYDVLRVPSDHCKKI